MFEKIVLLLLKANCARIPDPVETAEPAVGEAYDEGGEVAGRAGEKRVEDPFFNTVHSLVSEVAGDDHERGPASYGREKRRELFLPLNLPPRVHYGNGAAVPNQCRCCADREKLHRTVCYRGSSLPKGETSLLESMTRQRCDCFRQRVGGSRSQVERGREQPHQREVRHDFQHQIRSHEGPLFPELFLSRLHFRDRLGGEADREFDADRHEQPRVAEQLLAHGWRHFSQSADNRRFA
mmetsp:Transcript_33095/g.55430  ORF Transcript_33095/g.55430 Transcript_33095/m.55430 type:complete len:237 (-) Transcript_33095:734-1444(-)